MLNDFDGFGTAAPASGCTSVKVDAYVLQGGTWHWVEGEPSTELALALPGGVADADVGGLRIACAGDAVLKGESASYELNLVQRSLDRNTGASFETETRTTDNVVVGEAAVEGMDPATGTATAPQTIVPTTVAASATKNIDPSRIAAGGTAQAEISTTNISSNGVHELRMSDLDYFTEDLTFGGFTAPPTWPVGATSAQFVYYPLDGSAPVSVDFTEGATPAVPAGTQISGFELVYTGPSDAIAVNTSASAQYAITTDPDMAAEAEVSTTNNITGSVTTSSQRTATANANDDLTVVDPSINVDLTKSVLPASAVSPGESVVTALTSTTSAESEFIDPKTIVIEDSWGGGADEFWNAFNLESVAPTQIPPHSTLTVSFQYDGQWITGALYPSQDDPRTITLSSGEIASIVAPASIDEITGIRFTYVADDVFPAGTTVVPYFTSEARADLRDGSGAVTPGPDQPVAYANTATTTGTGVTPDGTTISGSDVDTDEASVITHDGTGPVGIDKTWDQPTVDSQSDQTRVTTLSWNVSPGFDTVTITDPSDPAAADSPQNTVFQVFDLTAVNSISSSDTPFSNGWWLKYDTIIAVELYDGTGWNPAPMPAGGWIDSSGAFVGYQLSGPERASTVGVRIVLEENAAARQAATQPGAAYDPYAPTVGSGVGASSASRSFGLTWQIRDKTRVGGEFVTGDGVYNQGSPGVVDNTGRLDAVRGDGTTATDTDDATILIIDQPPAVGVGKTANPGLLFVPPADSPSDQYPSTQFAITAQNQSTAAASYVRLTDPAPCAGGGLSGCTTPNTSGGATANPYTGIDGWDDFGSVANPFDRFDMTSVAIGASIPGQVDLDQTTVWVLNYDGAAFSSVQTTASAINAGAVDLSEAVGISVAFQGTDPATNGGSITAANVLSVTIDATLRPTIRSTGADQTVEVNNEVDLTNRVFAQSYDPVTAPGDAVANDNANANIVLSGGTIDVAPAKSVDPSSLAEPDRADPVTVTLGANSATSTLSPVSVRLEDQAASPDFWNTFDFTGLGTLTAPSGADQVQVDVYGPFGDDGALTWVTGVPNPIASPVVPVAAADYPDVAGIRFVYSNTSGAVFSPALPAPAWSAQAQFTVQVRDDYRDGSGPTPVVATIDNTVTVQSNGALASSDEKMTQATIELTTGTRAIAVNKLANNGTHFVEAGKPVPFRLQFQNTGTGYLTVSELRDVLPAQLAYLPDPAPTYTAQDGGLLSDDVTLSQEGQELVFSWPDDANVMAPGEIFEITLYLELQPVAANTQVTNTMVVTTEQTLESCSNIVTNGSTTPDFAGDPTTCGTTDYVSPAPGQNLFAIKGVKGSLDGAINPPSPGTACATFEALGESYYRSPCAANSVVNGVDDWVLHVANAGTTAIDTITVFDQLPLEGDQNLISGQSRGSQYRPEVVADSLAAQVPAGTSYILEVTQSPGVCVGTWPTVQTAEPCAQNGEVWIEVEPGADIDWADVTGVRLSLDFTGTASGALQPGEAVNLTFSTQNLPVTGANPGGVSTDVPGADEFAWNQFGVKYHSVGATSQEKIAPAQVGVHLLYGPIQVSKSITGPAASYAPSSFAVDAACEIGGVSLDLGDATPIELSSANAFTQRINGIPVGATCELTEQGDIGSYGETSRDGTPVTLAIDEAAADDDSVPAAQTAVVTNDYQMTGLSITKQVDTDATVGDFGPFTFTLSCRTGSGIPVTFDDAGTTELTFTLEDGGTFEAPEDRIPVGSTCTVSETDTAFADSTIVVGDNVTDNGDGTATVVPGASAAAVTFTNAYDAGVLQLVKVVDGDGAALYGAGPFSFGVQCTWQGQTVLDESYDLDAGASRTIGPLPNGTTCSVEETATGGANATQLDPAGDILIAVQPSGQPGPSVVPTFTVTATNTFDLTQLVVSKEVTGDTGSAAAQGIFAVTLACTRPVDGKDVAVDVPGGAQRSISAGQQVVYDSLPVDATCELTETDNGGADATQLAISGDAVTNVSVNGASGTATLGAADQATVKLTNHFDPQAGPKDPDDLASTGVDVWNLSLLAAGLILAGAGVLVLAYRRRGRRSA